MSLPESTHLKSPAKVNLFLHVTGKNDAGYHLLESLMVPVDVHDHITIAPSAVHSVCVAGEYAKGVGESNIVSSAIRCFELAIGITVDPLAITIEKHIPVSGGMGGGSSNAASILLYLRTHYAPSLSDQALIDIAVEVGADVPFFIIHQAAYVCGIGEQITPVVIPSIPAILINPNECVSTANIFKRGFSVYTDRSVRADTIPKDLDTLLDFLQSCSNDLTYNALKEQSNIVEVLRVLSALPECRLAQMSGSGATCFALFNNKQARDRAMRKLSSKQKRWWIKAVTFNA